MANGMSSARKLSEQENANRVPCRPRTYPHLAPAGLELCFPLATAISVESGGGTGKGGREEYMERDVYR